MVNKIEKILKDVGYEKEKEKSVIEEISDELKEAYEKNQNKKSTIEVQVDKFGNERPYARTPEELKEKIEIEGDKKDHIKESIDELKEMAGLNNDEQEEFLIREYKDNGDLKSIKVNIEKMAEHLESKYHFKTIFWSKFEEVFVYKNGDYNNDGMRIIQGETEKILKEHCTNHYVREICEKIKRRTETDIKDFEKVPEHIICVENGALDLKERKLLPHSPDYNFKTKIPVTFDKTKDCPNIKKFLAETLYEEDISTVQEGFGYDLYPRYFIKNAQIFFGAKNTGKTVLLNLKMKFLSIKNTAGISLQRISSGDKFALYSLKDKFANIYDDLSSKDVNDCGGFKIATGGGFITAERKFGDPIQFLNYAKHTFATNKIPDINEMDDDAYYDRWIPIAFDNQISKEEQDDFLIDKLTTKGELSGLLNYGLEGLKRLLEKGHFSFNKTTEEIKKIMKHHGNALADFVDVAFFEQEGNKISKDDMYEYYSNFVKKRGLQRLTKNQISRNLVKYCNYIQSRHGDTRYWVGVGIREEFKNKVSKDNTQIDTLDTFSNILCSVSESDVNNTNNDVIEKQYIISGEPSKVSKEGYQKKEFNSKRTKDIINKSMEWDKNSIPIIKMNKKEVENEKT